MEPGERKTDESLPALRPDSWRSTAVGSERLWTPWRLQYVVDGVKEEGCLFCNRLSSGDDASALILHRGKRAFVIMNLFPYNTGHVMIVPNDHVSSPEDLDAETAEELASLRRPLLRATRRALAAEGFNLGLNIGAVAGAGIAGHMHEHVVPRWQGDANFMPVLSNTLVMPELIPATYAKVRGELLREVSTASEAIGVVISTDGEAVLATSDAELPRVALVEGEPIWKTLRRRLKEIGVNDAILAGWASREPAGQGQAALMYVASPAETPHLANEYSWQLATSMQRPPDVILAQSVHDRIRSRTE